MRTYVVTFLAGCLAGCGSNSASSDSGASSDGAGTDGGTTTTGDGGATSGTFSFFVTSYKGLQRLSGSSLGFGGDLRYGETGAGAGLRGADKICTAIAEMSMPGSGAKGWHAFLSAPAMGTSPDVGFSMNGEIESGGPASAARLSRCL